MTLPRRAVLALALVLGLAAYTHAACDQTGTISLNMVTAASSSDPIAKCLSALTLDISDDSGNCKVIITPSGADGNFVPAVWGSSTTASNYYTVLQQCPTTAATYTGANTGTATATDAIKYALNHLIYGAVVTGANVDSVAYVAGKITATRTGLGNFVYAITASSATGTFALADCDGTPFTNGTECVTNVNIDCSTGTYGVQLSGIKICALCPAGTYNDGSGDGCTPCSAGHYATGVGASTCASTCNAGTYAEAGFSDCLPCPAGTYAGSGGAGVCNQCPTGTYSFIPGSTACLFCVAGVPKCQTGNGFTLNGGACGDTDAPSTASVGYSVLAGDSTALKAGLTTFTSANSYAKPALWKTCSGSPQLALTVDVDCSVNIQPITDTSCSEPGASGYSYNSLAITGYYDSKTGGKIRSLLPTNETSVASAFLLSITATSGASVTVAYWGATTDPTKSGDFNSTANDVVSGTFTVNGEAIVGSTPGATCPAGSYKSSSDCIACPVGYSCDGTSSTACTADQYNQYLGANSCSSCSACRGICTGFDSSTCSGGTCTGMTSYSAADYCTVPWFDISCGAGTQYDPAERKCVDCEAGTAGTGTCTACPAGSIAATSGLSTCSSCTGNNVAPVDGLSACQACPNGTIAAVDHQSCDPCPAGQYSDGTACQPCPDGYYRTGDSSPENNVCKPIPAGYRERMVASDPTGTNAAAAKSEIVPCEKGTYSSWNADPTDPFGGAARTPPVAQSTTCSACSGRNYAPRIGMQQCLICKAGTVPTYSVNDPNKVKGPDQCSSCLDGSDLSGATHNFGVWGYRDINTNSDQCGTCPGGSETGPSNHAACTPCRPGYFMTNDTNNKATAEFCSACPQNQAQPLPGQTSCTTCGVGEETFDQGNTVCSKCAKGYYNPTPGRSCIAAPAGGYVNITGASTYTACPVGTFSNEKGSDWCDLCPPGQYANTPGSKACKTCPAGTYSSGGSFTCKSCSPGYYAPSGSSICSPCKAGYFTSTTKSTTCSACPAGNQCPLIGTKTPTPCKAGYYAAKEASKICTPCPVNTFSTSTGSKTCSPCGPGFSTRGLTGQSKCQTVRPSLRRSLF